MSLLQYDAIQYQHDRVIYLPDNTIPIEFFDHFLGDPPENTVFFLHSLYWRVLAAQIVHFHYPEHYVAFQEAANFPVMLPGLAAGYPIYLLSIPLEGEHITIEDAITHLHQGMHLMIRRLRQSPLAVVAWQDFHNAVLGDPHVIQHGRVLLCADPPLSILKRSANISLRAALEVYDFR